MYSFVSPQQYVLIAFTSLSGSAAAAASSSAAAWIDKGYVLMKAAAEPRSVDAPNLATVDPSDRTALRLRVANDLADWFAPWPQLSLPPEFFSEEEVMEHSLSLGVISEIPANPRKAV